MSSIEELAARTHDQRQRLQMMATIRGRLCGIRYMQVNVLRELVLLVGLDPHLLTFSQTSATY